MEQRNFYDSSHIPNKSLHYKGNLHESEIIWQVTGVITLADTCEIV